MKKVMAFALALCLMVGLCGCGMDGLLDTLVEESIPDEYYFDAAKSIVSERLKNPSTAVCNDVSIYERDDYGRVIVYLDISAQNGYGGYVRYDWWVCITAMDADGRYSYNKYFSDTTERGSLELLKTANDFGEPREE